MVLYDFVEGAELLSVVGRSAIIFMYSFVLLRLLGRRRLSHLTYIDVLLIISFGSAVGDVMIYHESTAHLLNSIIAITVVAVLVKILDEFSSHSQRAQAVIEGKARLLVNNGQVIHKALAKENLSLESLQSLLRQKEIESISKLKKVFIEPDGELSIVFIQQKKKAKRS